MSWGFPLKNQSANSKGIHLAFSQLSEKGTQCQKDALLTLQTLHTFVDIKRGKTDRLMVIILGIVGGIIAISDALSEIPLYFRISLIIIVITWGIITWIIKREKK